MMWQQATTAAVVISPPRTLLLLVQLASQGVAMTWRTPTRLLGGFVASCDVAVAVVAAGVNWLRRRECA